MGTINNVKLGVPIKMGELVRHKSINWTQRLRKSTIIIMEHSPQWNESI